MGPPAQQDLEGVEMALVEMALAAQRARGLSGQGQVRIVPCEPLGRVRQDI
jgi:hypothetical protein